MAALSAFSGPLRTTLVYQERRIEVLTERVHEYSGLHRACDVKRKRTMRFLRAIIEAAAGDNVPLSSSVCHFHCSSAGVDAGECRELCGELIGDGINEDGDKGDVPRRAKPCSYWRYEGENAETSTTSTTARESSVSFSQSYTPKTSPEIVTLPSTSTERTERYTRSTEGQVKGVTEAASLDDDVDWERDFKFTFDFGLESSQEGDEVGREEMHSTEKSTAEVTTFAISEIPANVGKENATEEAKEKEAEEEGEEEGSSRSKRSLPLSSSGPRRRESPSAYVNAPIYGDLLTRRMTGHLPGERPRRLLECERLTCVFDGDRTATVCFRLLSSDVGEAAIDNMAGEEERGSENSFVRSFALVACLRN